MIRTEVIDVEPLGERAVRFAIPEHTDRAALLNALLSLPEVIDASVTETHAAAYFRSAPPKIDASILRKPAATKRTKLHTIDVVYDGVDLDEIAARAAVERERLISMHAAPEYDVSFVGFLPGFGYLRGLAPELAPIPRLDRPRARVAAGSIGVAGGFTGIYPFECPGGWRLIARAPQFDPFEDGEVRLAIGDRVRFMRIG